MIDQKKEEVLESIKKQNAKIFLATPAFQGLTHVSYAIALAETKLLLAKIGIDCVFNIATEGSLLCASRNRILEEFINSDCTHILCVDADLGWSHHSVLDMLYFNLDFVCGLYPTRKGDEYLYRASSDIVTLDGQEVRKLKNHEEHKALFRVEYAPAGFMLIKRCVIEKMREDRPQDKFVPKDGRPSGYALFNTEVYEDEFWGEDYVFCRKARESGFDLWAYPFIKFCHNGVVGCFGEKLIHSDK